MTAANDNNKTHTRARAIRRPAGGSRLKRDARANGCGVGRRYAADGQRTNVRREFGALRRFMETRGGGGYTGDRERRPFGVCAYTALLGGRGGRGGRRREGVGSATRKYVIAGRTKNDRAGAGPDEPMAAVPATAPLPVRTFHSSAGRRRLATPSSAAPAEKVDNPWHTPARAGLAHNNCKTVIPV